MNLPPVQQQQHISAYPSVHDPLPPSVEEVPVVQATTTTTELPRQRLLSSVNVQNVTAAYNSTESTVIEGTPISNHPRAKLVFRVSMALAVFNYLCVFIYLLTTPYHYFWPIHTIYCSLLFIHLLFTFTGPYQTRSKAYAAHSTIAILTALKFLLINLGTGRFPWSVFPISLIVLVYTIHTVHVVVPVYFTSITIHMIVFCIVNFVFFFVYCFTNRGFPWWLIILVFWAMVFAVHVIIYKSIQKKRRDRELQQQAQAQQPETVITNIQQPVYEATRVQDAYTGYPVQPPPQQSIYPQQPYNMQPQPQQQPIYPQYSMQHPVQQPSFVSQQQSGNAYQQNLYNQQ